MNYYSVFYWLTVADGVKKAFDAFSNIFTTLTIISLVAYVVVVIASIGSASDLAIAKDKNKNGGNQSNVDINQDTYNSVLIWRKFIGRTFWMSFIFCMITWFGYVMTPTKKDCLLIVAGGTVGNFITNDTSAKAIPADITKFLHMSLKEQIEKLNADTKQDIKKELGVQTPQEKLIDKVKSMSKDEIINYLKSDTTLKVKQ